MVSIKWIQFCKIRPGELDLFSLRHKYNWCLYKKIIKRMVKTVQPKNKYSHKEKKEYKESGINTGWKLFWTLETFFPNQALTKKEIPFTKGLVKDEAVVPRVTGEPPSEGDKAALPSPAPFGCRSCIWQEIVWTVPALSDLVHGICKGVDCFSNPGLGYLLALEIFVFQYTFADWNTEIFRWETTDLDKYTSCVHLE